MKKWSKGKGLVKVADSDDARTSRKGLEEFAIDCLSYPAGSARHSRVIFPASHDSQSCIRRASRLEAPSSRLIPQMRLAHAYLYVMLAGREREPNETDSVNGDNLITDIEMSAARSGRCVSHVGNHHGGQHRSPSRLDDDHSEDFVLLLGDDHLG